MRTFCNPAAGWKCDKSPLPLLLICVRQATFCRIAATMPKAGAPERAIYNTAPRYRVSAVTALSAFAAEMQKCQ
jgi:hypothetical protein